MKRSAVSKTSIWRPGHGPGSVFVDMTGRKESKFEFLSLIAKQYPSRVGVITQQVGSMKFAEINFDPDDIALNDFLTNGILLEPTTRTYMCTGYAVLNVSAQHTKFKQLTHLIPWDEKREQGFYAVWNQMPHYCRYCHEEGHVPSKRARKRPETSVAIQPSVEEASTLLVTTKYPETTDAPTIDIDTYPNVKNQVHSDVALPHNPPVVLATPLITSPSSTTASPGKTGPKRSRPHAAQKPYKRPITRSQSVPPKELIYVPSVSIQVGQTDTMLTDSPMDSSSSAIQADAGPTTPMLNNMSNKSQRLLLHIASLNCHSLVKSNNPKKQSRFIRYLRSLKFDIMTFQETHVSDNTLSIINTQFQARYFMCTRH
ncbi:hypothetical protein G6F37_012027 [Rhizopus arrhizus]|nr:hypothetical protein G6F38_012070 [Rhizopus arrhizus]KAG1146126.1 hypothetical protein G6F37_012027 [Rhizopus arrhizus]